MTKQPAKPDNVDDEPEDGVFAIPEGLAIPEDFQGVRKYPPANMKHLVQRVEGEGAEKFTRDWTGNDTNARNHNSIVYLIENTLRLRLSWKENKKDTARVVGVFDLHLPELLDKDYVRIEKGVTRGGKKAIRLRFYHDPNGIIYIQVNTKGPRLPVGFVS